MKKQRVQLIALVIVLAVLCAGFAGLKQYNKLQAEKPEEETGTTIVEMESEEVVRFTYDYNEETNTFEKEEDTWYLASDHTLTIMQSRMTNMLSKVAPLQVTNVIENVTDLSQYGLEEPSRTIQYESAAESYIFYVGDYNSMTGLYYICAPSTTTVYTVESQVISSFNFGLDELVEEEEEAETETEVIETEEEETQTEAEAEIEVTETE